jgi:hypothetical protein
MQDTFINPPKQSNPKGTKKQRVTTAVVCLIVLNTVVFMVMAALGTLNVEGRMLVFVDFWGRFTVYSLWYTGYLFYLKFLRPRRVLASVFVALLVLNIPVFLTLAYLDKVTSTPQTLVFIDFWGRITVYSLWFLGLEAYRAYEEKA